MANYYFVGYSTTDTDTTGRNHYYDVELVNRDLQNAFQTRVGERVMRPAYGCKLWDWVMDPLTPDMKQKIEGEALRICQTDSRVSVQTISIYDLSSGFRVEITLLYQPLNVIGTFTQDFEDRQNTLTGGVSS